MPNAGELRQSVRFERRAIVEDGYGNERGDWEVLIDRRSAKLTPTRGGDQVVAGRQQGVAAWDLWVRFDSATRGVTTDDRVVDRADPARSFNIKFIGDMDGRRRFLLMQLEAGRGDG
jgi:head-tail adaptor